ncbi:helix-turn-helix domain-containing protein [Streptomyces sp. NPDC059104]|uniref:helix-turn-helix domain-containing protein n=1 Tax=Streptomyces sp. NPDC059104 TaxID=3346729 RepID=UPI0036A54391
MTQGVETTSDAELGLPSPKERRRLREAGRLTHEEVAATAGVTATTVRSWETGRTEPRGRKREVYAALLARLAEAEAEAPAAEADPPAVRAATTTSTTPPEPPGPPEPPTPEAVDAPAGPAVGAAPRAGAAGVRAFAAGGVPTRAGGPGTRPRPAGKGAARPPVSLARHETKHPVRTGAGGGGPSPAPAGPTDPPPSAPPRTDPARPDPRAGAPARPDPIQPDPRAADPTRPGPARPEPTRSEPTQPDPRAAGPARPDPNRPDPTQPDPQAFDPTQPDPQAAGPARTDPQAAGPARPDPTPPGPQAAGPARPDPAPPGASAQPPPTESARAFDALYLCAAPALVRQTYLLTGRRALARQSVEHAFRQAWGRWPEVATDPDPVGWVRAIAYEYALSPWRRFRRAYRNPDPGPVEPVDRMLLDALLDLPPAHRRTVLLYDGIGLDLPDTAAETEASTPAAGNRLLRAHVTLAARVPGLADVPPERQSAVLRELLGGLRPAVQLEPRSAPAGIRALTERTARRWSRAAICLTAAIAVATGYTAVTAPDRYVAPVAPGSSVSGVPPHSGPQRLTDQSRELREKLRGDPAAGPARISPALE